MLVLELRPNEDFGEETLDAGSFGAGSFGDESFGVGSFGNESLGVVGACDGPEAFLPLTSERFFAARLFFFIGASEKTDLTSYSDLTSEQTDLVSSMTLTLSMVQGGVASGAGLHMEAVSVTESKLLTLIKPGVFSFSPSL